MKLAKASQEEIDRLMSWLQARENSNDPPPPFNRVVIGYETLLGHCCDPSKDYLDFKPGQSPSEIEAVRAAFKECARERIELINGICEANSEVGRIIDRHFDEDSPEGSMGTPPRPQLRDLQAHLEGTCIGSDGEYMPREKYAQFIGPLEVSEHTKSPNQPRKVGSWTQTPPIEQGKYWHWSGDRDHAPLPMFVLWSGTQNKCFVSAGQLGIEHAVMCEEYGGWWMPLHAPELPANT